MNYHNITTDDMRNGEGLRTVLWVAGCLHRCPGCQNPITWNPNGGLYFDEAAEDEFFEKLSKDYISGATFSGGDPWYPTNRNTILRLSRKIKNMFGPNKTIWMYTGYVWEEMPKRQRLDCIDVLVDGPFIKELADIKYPWAGSTNQRVIDIPKTLKNNNKIILKETR